MIKFNKLFGGTLSTIQPNQNNTANELNNNKDRKVAISKTIELDVLNKQLSELQDAYSHEVIVGEHLEKTLKTEQQTYASLNTRFHELEQQKIKHLEIAKQLADYLADFETEEVVNNIQTEMGTTNYQATTSFANRNTSTIIGSIQEDSLEEIFDGVD